MATSPRYGEQNRYTVLAGVYAPHLYPGLSRPGLLLLRERQRLRFGSRDGICASQRRLNGRSPHVGWHVHI